MLKIRGISNAENLLTGVNRFGHCLTSDSPVSRKLRNAGRIFERQRGKGVWSVGARRELTSPLIPIWQSNLGLEPLQAYFDTGCASFCETFKLRGFQESGESLFFQFLARRWNPTRGTSHKKYDLKTLRISVPHFSTTRRAMRSFPFSTRTLLMSRRD